jgi:hypothetical protein
VVRMSSGSSELGDVRVHVDVDMGRLGRKWNKMLSILSKECPVMSDAYFVSVMLVAWFEETFGFEASPETINSIRKIFADVVVEARESDVDGT